MFFRSLVCTTGLALGMLVVVLAPASASAQSSIQGVGTWRLNIARSQLGPGPSPRSVTSTIEAIGQTARVTGVRIDADGTRTEARYTAGIDGKDYPIQGSAIADTVCLKRIDERTVERVDKRAGKVVETSTTVFSADGKTSTTKGKGRSARGVDFDYVALNERQ